MPRKSPHLALILVAAACGKDAASATAAKPRVIAYGDALALSITPERCTVTGEAALEVTRQGADTIATMGATTLTLGAGRTGTEIFDAEGITQLRVIDQAGQLALVSKEGIPVARVFTTETQASVVDAARAPLFTVTRDGDHLTVLAANDSAPPATVTGTDDLTLAAALALPGVSPAFRALLACARALPAPAPATASSDSP